MVSWWLGGRLVVLVVVVALVSGRGPLGRYGSRGAL